MGKLNWAKQGCFALLLCAATAIALPGQTFRTVHSFDGTDGANPYAALLQDTDGNLYGTTLEGGANLYYGTVFKIARSGTLTTLYSFCSESGCTDGANPLAPLVQDRDGDFYGTTDGGGAYNAGTVFKITRRGTLTTLHNFDYTDGNLPGAALVQDRDGNFYGTTAYGGTSSNCVRLNGCGTVFKITRWGTLTMLHNFDYTEGARPSAALVQGRDGNFYGTTVLGGAYSAGTVFKITRSGTLTTLYSFCPEGGCTDGGGPWAPLVQDRDGNFYGTTQYGGASSACSHGCGTVFKITRWGTLTTVHSFDYTDGQWPYAALVQDADGNFYGTTYRGGDSGDGTVFKITRSGTLTTLHSFEGTDGANPFAALVQDTDGNFYGTTEYGGDDGYGTVFSLSPIRDKAAE